MASLVVTRKSSYWMSLQALSADQKIVRERMAVPFIIITMLLEVRPTPLLQIVSWHAKPQGIHMPEWNMLMSAASTKFQLDASSTDIL